MVASFISFSIYIFALVFFIAEDSSATSTDEDNKTDCPAFGCPFLPLDVNYDPVARDALLVLRQDPSEKNSNLDRETALQTLLSAGDEGRSVLTLKSYKGGQPKDQINQDSAMIYSPYLIPSPNKKELPCQLLGVFDGHGFKGEITSQYAATKIPQVLSEKLSTLTDWDDENEVSKAIEMAFMKIDETDPTHGIGGSTASLVLQVGEGLYVANAGDSVSFISVIVKDESFVVYQSREDKPDLPEERKRITDAGGYVHITKDGSDVPRAYAILEDGTLGSGLAMSRCIGDWENQGVIAVPLVSVLNVTEILTSAMNHQYETCLGDAKVEDMGDEEKAELKDCTDHIDPESIQILAVSATDGLIDYFDVEEIASALAPSFFLSDEHPHSAVEKLILKSAQLWDMEHDGQYRDDITIAAARVFVSNHDRNVMTTTADDKKETSDEL